MTDEEFERRLADGCLRLEKSPTSSAYGVMFRQEIIMVGFLTPIPLELGSDFSRLDPKAVAETPPEITRTLRRLRRAVDRVLLLNGVAFGLIGTVLLLNLIGRILR